jgi:hypothetical protein
MSPATKDARRSDLQKPLDFLHYTTDRFPGLIGQFLVIFNMRDGPVQLIHQVIEQLVTG